MSTEKRPPAPSLPPWRSSPRPPRLAAGASKARPPSLPEVAGRAGATPRSVSGNAPLFPDTSKVPPPPPQLPRPVRPPAPHSPVTSDKTPQARMPGRGEAPKALPLKSPEAPAAPTRATSPPKLPASRTQSRPPPAPLPGVTGKLFMGTSRPDDVPAPTAGRPTVKGFPVTPDARRREKVPRLFGPPAGPRKEAPAQTTEDRVVEKLDELLIAIRGHTAQPTPRPIDVGRPMWRQ